MSCLGNLIWLIFGGFAAGLGYMLGGALICLTVVGIPFGLQCIKYGVMAFAPFGKEVQPAPGSGGTMELVFNIIWAIFFGWEIAIAHLGFAGLLAITIVGLPFARQHIKMIPLALFPFGKEIV